MFWEKRSKDFESKVFFIAQAVGAALDDSDFIVHTFDEAKADFVVDLAVGDDAIPVAFNHRSELFHGAQALPLELLLPIVKKLSRPGWMTISPKSAERFFEQIGFEELGIGIEESLERFTAFTSQMIPVGEQGVALPFDEATVFLAEAEVLLTADLVNGIVEMAQDMELIVNDSDVRPKADCVGKRFPHIHDCQLDFRSLARPQPAKEHLQIFLAAPVTSNPNGALSIQIADNDPINMPFANRDFINANGAGSGTPSTIHQLLKILFLQILDGMPRQAQQCGNTRQGLFSTHPAHLQSKTPGEVAMICQPFHALGFHLAANEAIHAADFHLQVNALVSASHVPNMSGSRVVETPHTFATTAANRFFVRRTRVMTRACGSPHTPFSRPNGRKPAKRYSSSKVCPVFMRHRLSQKSRDVHAGNLPRKNTHFLLKKHEIHPHETTKTLKKELRTYCTNTIYHKNES